MVEFERNFVDGQDGPQEDAHEMQEMRASLVSHEAQEMLLLRLWCHDNYAQVLLDDSVSRLD